MRTYSTWEYPLMMMDDEIETDEPLPSKTQIYKLDKLAPCQVPGCGRSTLLHLVNPKISMLGGILVEIICTKCIQSYLKYFKVTDYTDKEN